MTVTRAPQRDRHDGVARPLGGGHAPAGPRTPEIVCEAAHAVLVLDPRACTGNPWLDEQAPGQGGVADPDRCRVVAGGGRVESDLFLPPQGRSA